MALETPGQRLDYAECPSESADRGLIARRPESLVFVLRGPRAREARGRPGGDGSPRRRWHIGTAGLPTTAAEVRRHV